MRPVSHSEVDCFRRCEREWQHRYLDKREGLVPSESLARGKRVHAWLAAWWSKSLTEVELLASERAMCMGYSARYERPHLTHVEVSKPFRATIGGVDVVGELDVHGWDGEDEIIVEHKTTTRDIAPGSQYWRERIHCDPQVSTYLDAFPRAKVLYDVLRVPALRQLGETKTRKAPESDEAFIARILEDMAERPEHYFQRVYMVRLEQEHEDNVRDLEMVAESMARCTKYTIATARNPRSCFQYGRECDFFGVCWMGRDITALPVRDESHRERLENSI
jgi:PD-(D/E)XK nuclease superfamily protein